MLNRRSSLGVLSKGPGASSNIRRTASSSPNNHGGSPKTTPFGDEIAMTTTSSATTTAPMSSKLWISITILASLAFILGVLTVNNINRNSSTTSKHFSSSSSFLPQVNEEAQSVLFNDRNLQTGFSQQEICNQFRLSKSLCSQMAGCRYNRKRKSCNVIVTKSPTMSPTTSVPTIENDDDTGEIEIVSKGTYNIDIVFLNSDVPSFAVDALNNAKTRWEKIIFNDLESVFVYTANKTCYGLPATKFPYDVVVDDLVIFTNIISIDGPGGILGSAGPCQVSTTEGNFPKFTRVGLMQYDLADITELYSDGTLETVMLHEMGHILGIGTLWNMFGVKKNYDYTGAGGIQGLLDVGGSGLPKIEADGGPGTAGGHFDEETYHNELMTGYLSANTRLSLLTVKSLIDLGYQPNVANADLDYQVPKIAVRGRQLEEPHGRHVGKDVINLKPEESPSVPYSKWDNSRQDQKQKAH